MLQCLYELTIAVCACVRAFACACVEQTLNSVNELKSCCELLFLLFLGVVSSSFGGGGINMN